MSWDEVALPGDPNSDETISHGNFFAVRASSFGTALVFATFGVVSLILRPLEYSLTERLLDILAVLVASSAALWTRKRRASFTFTKLEATGLAVASLAALNIALSTLIRQDPDNLLFLPLVVVAYGAVSLTWYGFAILGGGCFAAVFAICHALGVGDDATSIVTAQLIGTVSGLSMVASRRSYTRELVALRRREQDQNKELALANAQVIEQLRLQREAENRRQKLEEERAELQSRLEKTQRLDALGTLAGGVAHDMNNMLAAIGMTAETWLKRGARDDSTADVTDILEAVEQASSLTRNLLAFAQHKQQQHAATRIQRVVGKSIELLKRTLPKGIVLTAEVDDAIEPIMADGGQLANALVNLCLNAAEALDGQGHVKIEAVTIRIAEGAGALSPGSWVMITVSDDGPGMDQTTAERALEPFFSTKSEGHVGLGLSMVYGMVRQHQGELRIESQPGEGTKISIYLPAGTAAGVLTPSLAPEAEPFGRVRALVVDDEALVRRAMGRLLRSIGADVVLVSNGREALTRYREEAFDVVFLDVAMPELSGPIVFARLREADPQVKVVFISGYPKGAEIESLLDAGACDFLNKPCSMEQLRRTLAAIIATSRCDKN
jgi:signal transduction histidine kinase/ActR/RegA family two-component response regulator